MKIDKIHPGSKGTRVSFVRTLRRMLKKGIKELDEQGNKLNRSLRRMIIASLDVQEINKKPMGKRYAVDGLYQNLLQLVDIFNKHLKNTDEIIEADHKEYFSLHAEVENILSTTISFRKQLLLEQSKIDLENKNEL